jgi:L-methionine (R)-S-oxide reductase
MTDDLFLKSLSSLLSGGEENPFFEVTLLSNASAFLFQELEDVSWAGFYLRKGGMLYLGPFQGRVACTVIPVGKGVCGTALKEERTVIVPDVHLFPGHIACDGRSESEIVVPVHGKAGILAVLDLDSPTKGRFTEKDAALLEKVASLIGGLLS